jgi:predicted lysophospholipase L1 biosynthesis ABC-type transport system permease subunit
VAVPFVTPPLSIGELNTQYNALINLLQRMIDVGVILCLIIAGCGLAVSVAGGLVERKRAFALLRLAGLPLRRLYRSVLLEAAVPLVLAAVTSGAVGFLVAGLIIWSTGGAFSLAAPGPGYFGMVVGGLVAALAVVAATLPLVARMTEPGSVRME